jgi:type IV secretion system protein TrbJ
MKKMFAIAILGIEFTSIPAFAVFGIGDIVFDPSAYGQLVEQLAQLEQQYAQLVKTYTMVTNQYNQMVTNAKWIVSKARWRAMLTPWTRPTATNTYGTTGGWIGAVNSGAASLAGYTQAVTKLNTYASVWGSIGSAQQDLIGRNYSGIELSDGATANALEQMGRIRGNSAAVETAIDTLENDSLSDSPELNTEVGVLNKINAAGIIGVRNTQDSNKLLASILDHQMVEAKARRDAQAQSINNDIALRQIAPAVDTQHLTGTTAVLTTYRLP